MHLLSFDDRNLSPNALHKQNTFPVIIDYHTMHALDWFYLILIDFISKNLGNFARVKKVGFFALQYGNQKDFSQIVDTCSSSES